jgi:hypothetical protein
VDVDYARVALLGPASPSAIADLNGDGGSDFLWHNSSGEGFVWELNGTGLIGGGSVGNPGPSWHTMGTA